MKKPQSITDAELAILNELWDRGPLSARGVTETLYPECSASDVGTVHSLLKRLETKGMVSRDRSCHPHQFAAAVVRARVVGDEVEAMAARLTRGSLTPFLTHLVESQRLTPEELDELQQLLDAHRSKSNRKRGR